MLFVKLCFVVISKDKRGRGIEKLLPSLQTTHCLSVNYASFHYTWTDRQTDRQIARRDGQTDRWTDGYDCTDYYQGM